MFKRRQTRTIYLGNIPIGSRHPISIQSMTKTDTRDEKSTIRQIKRLEKEGCEIIRCAVLDMEAAKKLKAIKQNINIPLIADIHFDYKLALESIKSNVDGLRLNPGNIKDKNKIKEVVKAAKEKNICIRVGVNSGSVPRSLLKKYTPEKALVEAALAHINILEKNNFHNIKISLKSTDILSTLKAYKLMAKQNNYPFHIGITEAGSVFQGNIISSAGIALLLYNGLGDTVRISLSDNPVYEVRAAKILLNSLELRKNSPIIKSCPTCGRLEYPMKKILRKVEEKLKNFNHPIKVAVMGCSVNGPGEAIDSDFGIAGGKNVCFIFVKGKVTKKIKPDKAVDVLFDYIKKEYK